MRSHVNGIRLAVAGICLAALASAAPAGDIYVATNGADAAGRGGPGDPYRTIKYALAQSVSGDMIHVRAGTYAESWIQFKSGVTVISEDGLYAAKIYGANVSPVRLEGISNAEIRGFEVYGNYNGGSWTDSILRVYNASNIRVRDCLIRDAQHDGDVVKIGGAGATTSNVLFENCVIYNPAPRSGDMTGASGWQENVDIYPASAVTFRGCWVYHTPSVGGDTLIYCKGGSSEIVWENNVFGPVYNKAYNNPSVSAGAPSPYQFPSSQNVIVRNNLLLGCAGDGAFAMVSSRNVEFYNNIIWDYKGSRGAIEFYTVQIGLPRNEIFKCYNNIIMNTNGTPAFFDRGKWTADGTNIPVVFEHDYNLYFGISGGGDVNINAEAHSLINVNPQLTGPTTPVPGTDTWASIVARFRPLGTSPAINAALNLAALVATDIYGVARPYGTACDIGAYEYTLPGDVDRDTDVDVFDVIDTILAFGAVPGDAHWNAGADFDHDGQITVLDVTDVVTHFGQVF